MLLKSILSVLKYKWVFNWFYNPIKYNKNLIKTLIWDIASIRKLIT